jgi:hypothetical protein
MLLLRAAGARLRSHHLLGQRRVPVVLDFIVCSPRQPPGDQGPPAQQITNTKWLLVTFFITVSVIKVDDVSYGFSISDRAILLRSVKCFGLFRMDEARVRKRLLLLLYLEREGQSS